ncbi:hypothetical protein [Sphingomonas sp.]|uniref:hypothetical protein n=1 Tax=Sphingomonas sp. TaxID=28214 RepID=UPI002C317BBB|nr:hypothetical protein [Sphingomonas sp.]HTG37973.1 hypothetical protein [Sphingomonas sp.]
MKITPAFPYAAWATLGTETWMLGFEAAGVIAARMHGFAWSKPGSDREATRMVEEKLHALAELQWAMMTGAMGTTPLAISQKTVDLYRKKVGANRRRLSR